MACPAGWYRVRCAWLQARITAIQVSSPGIGEQAALAEALIIAATNFGPLGGGSAGAGDIGPAGYGFPVGPTGFG
jgi:hypothetical protein